MRLSWFRVMMIVCANPDSWPVLDYTDYGCYCGKGSSAHLCHLCSNCCQIHDQCYSDAIQHEDCWTIFDNPYTEIYSYKCDRASKTVSCKDECSA
ncbi:unnamed protein product [Coregonus sp. 'balchen']|nr:unnamed protein product [Coregonus sp. 'balchen']